MARPQKPFTTPRRNDSKTFQITLNPSCGLPARICREWRCRNFQDFPDELSRFRNPRTKSAAEAGAFALVGYLKRKMEAGTVRKVRSEDVSVGAWIEMFTSYETSPRTGINASVNRTFAGVIIFIRMAFRVYQKKFTRWINPFQGLDPPRIRNGVRDALPEDEVIGLFAPGVLQTVMELAVCAAMFLSGLRRAEISALRPEDLDWHTPKILVRRAWQNFEKKPVLWGRRRGKKSGPRRLTLFCRKRLKPSGRTRYGGSSWCAAIE
ncbi:MAG: hypothetical protein LBC88_03765 [Spirochaetaceae bacterium]|jgi:integrase|nr:hypothetical protein [Spirochaetaceae bacterium]